MAELELTPDAGRPPALRPPRRGDAAAARALRSRGHGRGRREPLAAPEARAARTGGRRHGLDGLAGGRFEPHGLRRGGILRWNGRELALRPASAWRERYALADGDAELATVESKGWGRRPVKVVVEDDATLEAGLLSSPSTSSAGSAKRRAPPRRPERPPPPRAASAAAACRGTSAGSAAAPSAVRPRARPGDGGCLRRVRRAGDPARARATTAAATAVGTDARPPALRPRGSTEPCRSRPRRAAAAARATTARPPATSGSGRRGGGRTASRQPPRDDVVRYAQPRDRAAVAVVPVEQLHDAGRSPRSAIHSSSCG